MNHTIERIYRSTTDKNGQTLKTRDGKPYERVSIKVSGNPDWISGFGNPLNAEWQEGQTVDIDIQKSPDGKYWNFKMPNKTSALESRLEALEHRVAKLEMADATESGGVPEEEIDFKDIPF